MKIAIIAGSHRKNSESERIGRYIERDLKKLGAQTYLLSLAENPLPLFDEELREGKGQWPTVWGPVSSELKSSEGVVVISPEWGGMVPAGLKNLFLLAGSGEFAHKAGLIVAVSSGLGGSYPIAELRTSSYKNSRLCYIPDHVIVRNCGEMLQGEAPANKHDQSLRERITYSLKVLLQYSAALKTVRESGVIDSEKFPFGM